MCFLNKANNDNNDSYDNNVNNDNQNNIKDKIVFSYPPLQTSMIQYPYFPFIWLPSASVDSEHQGLPPPSLSVHSVYLTSL